MYSQEVLDSIQRALPIDTVIREYVELTGEGTRLKGVCPFHQDSHPSFYVYTDKGFFRCYGCNAGGNQFTFIKTLLDVKFPDAVRHLAQKAGIPLPDLEENHPPACNLEPLEDAAQLYEQTLWQHPELLGYLRTRGLTEDTIRTFRLGYTPSGNVITKTFLEKFSSDDLLQVDLIRKSKHRTNGFYDMFRDRLMFPICNAAGRVVAFGGRTLDDEVQPKYLNTSAHPMFHKGEILYGFHKAKEYIRKSGKAHLTEGYFDFLAMWQHGVRDTLGTMGTALTKQHIELIRRYGNHLVCVFDGDVAGNRAISRHFMNGGSSRLQFTNIARNLLTEWTVTIARLPEEDDPSSLILKNPNEFDRLLASPEDLLPFLYDLVIPDSSQDNLAEKQRAAQFIASLIGQLPTAMARQHNLEIAVAKLHMPETVFLSQFRAVIDGAGVPSNGAGVPKRTFETGGLHALERHMIRAAVSLPKEDLRGVATYYKYLSPITKLFFERLFETCNGHFTLSGILLSIDNQYHPMLTALCSEGFEPEQSQRIWADCLNHLEIKSTQEQIYTLQEQILKTDDPGELTTLETQKTELHHALSFLKQTYM